MRTPIKKGDRGVDVGRIQTVLVKLKLLPEKNPNGTSSIDSDFGGLTEGAVSKFQQKSGLPATGVVDFDTLRALIPYRTVTVSGVITGEHKLQFPRMRLLPVAPTTTPIVPHLSLDPHDMDPPRGTSGYPFPYPLPATPSTPNTGAGVVFQPQFGPQYLGRPLWYAGGAPGSPAPGPSMSWPFNFWVTYRTAKDGMHWEFSGGPGFSVNHKYYADDPRFTLSANASISLADIWAPGSFHLISPNLQFGLYENLDGTQTAGVSTNIVNQMSWEILPDRLVLAVTPGFWLSHDFMTGQTILAPGVAGWVGGNF
jgi:peptidoglycan hydrolase-like protein with peptidoglycan-binding domain